MPKKKDRIVYVVDDHFELSQKYLNMPPEELDKLILEVKEKRKREDEEAPHLSKAIQHFKATEEGRDEMCALIEEYANELADKKAVDTMIETCIMHDDSKEKTVQFVLKKFPHISEEQISKRVSELWNEKN